MAIKNELSQSPSISEVWRDFETKQEALERRAKLVCQLQNGDDSAQEVAAKLTGCERHRRCGSPICPICVGELRLLVHLRDGRLR
jgi:hypothetical protein